MKEVTFVDENNKTKEEVNIEKLNNKVCCNFMA